MKVVLLLNVIVHDLEQNIFSRIAMSFNRGCVSFRAMFRLHNYELDTSSVIYATDNTLLPPWNN